MLQSLQLRLEPHVLLRPVQLELLQQLEQILRLAQVQATLPVGPELVGLSRQLQEVLGKELQHQAAPARVQKLRQW